MFKVNNNDTRTTPVLSLLLTLNIFHILLWCCYCYLWAGKCRLGKSIPEKIVCRRNAFFNLLLKFPLINNPRLISRISYFLTGSKLKKTEKQGVFLLTHFSPMSYFRPLWKHQKTMVFFFQGRDNMGTLEKNVLIPEAFLAY